MGSGFIEPKLQLCSSYVLFTEQLQVVSLRRAPDPPLSLQHLQLVGMSPLAAVQCCCRVHSELLHPDNTSEQRSHNSMAAAATTAELQHPMSDRGEANCLDGWLVACSGVNAQQATEQQHMISTVSMQV